MTLKEMLNQALSEIGFSTYQGYFGSTKQEPLQVAALANRAVAGLVKRDWQALRQDFLLSMTTANTYSLPTGFRHFTPDAAWSNTRRVNFPVGADEWNYYEARGLTTGLKIRMRRADDQLEIQNPQDGQTIVMQYISANAVKDNAGTGKPKFTADDDTFVLDDDLLILDVRWRFLRAKGLDYQGELAEYNQYVTSEIGLDSGARTIDTGTDGFDDLCPPTANLWIGG